MDLFEIFVVLLKQRKRMSEAEERLFAPQASIKHSLELVFSSTRKLKRNTKSASPPVPGHLLETAQIPRGSVSHPDKPDFFVID